MEITKVKFEREGCYNFYLNDGDKVLSIIFCGNLDLYWNLQLKNIKLDENNINSEKNRKIMYGELKGTFTITKENYFIYSLFEKLYDDIQNALIFEPVETENTDEEQLVIEDDSFDKWNILTDEKIKEKNEHYKQRDYYKLLFDGEKIEWHSDDESYDVADRVEIRKVDDTFVLEFIRPEMTEGKYFYFRAPGSISIRFRNSGSLYDPFNVIFMRMFNSLQEYEPEYHQIHLEEMNYQRRLLKK